MIIDKICKKCPRSKWVIFFIMMLCSFNIMNILSFAVIERSVVEREIEYSKKNQKDIAYTQKIIIDEKINNILLEIRFLVRNLSSDFNVKDGHLSAECAKLITDYVYSDTLRKDIVVYDRFGRSAIGLNYKKGDLQMVSNVPEISNFPILKSGKKTHVKIKYDEEKDDTYFIITAPIISGSEFQGAVVSKYYFADIGEGIRVFTQNDRVFSYVMLNNKQLILSDTKENKDNQEEYMSELELIKNDWDKIMAADTGQFQNDQGLISFDSINIDEKYYINLLEVDENSKDLKIIIFDPLIRFKLEYFTGEGMAYLLNQYFKTQKLSIAMLFLLTGSILAFFILKEKNRKKMEYMASLDLMTDTFNRARGMDLLEESQKECRKNKRNLTLAFIDINGLKTVNDNLGHEVGDELLVSTVKMLKENLGIRDYVIRLGGDEFLVIFPAHSTPWAEEILERTSDDIDKENKNNSKAYNMSFSYGIATVAYDEDRDMAEIINEADKKMYEKKRIMKKNINILK